MNSSARTMRTCVRSSTNWSGSASSRASCSAGADRMRRFASTRTRTASANPEALGRRRQQPSAHARPHRVVCAGVHRAVCRALSHLRKLQSDESVYLAAIDRLKATHRRRNWAATSPKRCRGARRLRGQVSAARRAGSRARGLAAVHRVAEAAARPSLAPLLALLRQVKFTTPPFQAQFRAIEREPAAVAGCRQANTTRWSSRMAQRRQRRRWTACRRCRLARGPM